MRRATEAIFNFISFFKQILQFTYRIPKTINNNE